MITARIGTRIAAVVAALGSTATFCLSGVSFAQRVSGTLGPSTATTTDLSYVRSQIAKYSKIPSFIAPGPSFDAKRAVAGKTIFDVSINASTQFSQRIEDGYQQVAKLVGAKLTWWPNQGEVSQWAQGIQTAINEKASVIDLSSGLNPSQVSPQVAAAEKAHIPVTVSDAYNTGTPAPKGITAVGDVPYTLPAKLMADWLIDATGGHVDALFITANDNITSPAAAAAFRGTLAKYCGSSCKVKFANADTADWATKITPEVTAAIDADPHLNYIAPIYDSMVPYVIAGINADGASNRVKVVSFNGSPPILKLMQQKGSVLQMDVGENVNALDWAMMDQIMRVMAHAPLATNEHIGLYIWTQKNVDRAGVPPAYNKGYGTAYVTGFERLWRLSK